MNLASVMLFTSGSGSFLGGGWFFPVVILILAIVFVLTVKYAVSRRKNIAPGRVGVFYGREFKWEDGTKHGYLAVSGGGRVQRPVLENYVEVPVEAFQIAISEKEVPNKDNVLINVEGVATCKVSSDPAALDKAITSLLSKLSDSHKGEGNTMETFVQNILTGHLRSIVGKMNIEELIRDREGFNRNLVTESKVELQNLGIDLVNLAVKDIRDKEGYIEALGKKAVAKAKADAEIEVSNANRDRDTTKAQNDALVAEAEKERDVKKAQYKATSETEQAKSDMAKQIETAAQQRTLKVAEAERDAAETEAKIKVQQKEGERMKAQLQATLVATAAANKEQTILNAEAEQRVKVITAQANREAAEANKAAAIAQGEGDAQRNELVLTAQAKGDAAKTKEELLAKAAGTQAMAAAFASMNESGKLIVILDRLPALLKDGGDAGAKMLEAVFKSVAAPLASIDRISIVDMGGGEGSNGINKLTSIVPSAVFGLLTKAKAAGFDIEDLLKKAGIDPVKALAMFGGDSSHEASPAATAPPAAGK